MSTRSFSTRRKRFRKLFKLIFKIAQCHRVDIGITFRELIGLLTNALLPKELSYCELSNRMPAPKTRNLLAYFLSFLIALAVSPAVAESRANILVLGDSQISFSAGGPYLKFFEDLGGHCNMDSRRRRALEKLGTVKAAAFGVRSTSIRSWTARGGASKDTICEVDKKYGVNAGVYGVGGDPKRRFVQIGKGKELQFCDQNTSPLESALRKGYYDPDLVVFAFLGNDARSWAEDEEGVLAEVEELSRQFPKDIGCVFLTTAPVYSKKTNDLRMRAQDNLISAFEKVGGQCAFVAGFSEETRAVIEGKPRYFRRHENGKVKDPLHPNASAIRQFLEINTPALCDAVFDVLD